MAGVQDKRNHAEVSAGQAVLQEPRECSSLPFLFPCVVALSLLDPFLGIPGFASTVTCRRSVLSFLRIITAPNDAKEKKPPGMEGQGYWKRCPNSDRCGSHQMLGATRVFLRREKGLGKCVCCHHLHSCLDVTRHFCQRPRPDPPASVGRAGIQVDSVPSLAPDGCNPKSGRRSRLELLGGLGPPVLPRGEWDVAFNQRVLLSPGHTSEPPGPLQSPQACVPITRDWVCCGWAQVSVFFL